MATDTAGFHLRLPKPTRDRLDEIAAEINRTAPGAHASAQTVALSILDLGSAERLRNGPASPPRPLPATGDPGIGAELKALREGAGISQRKLADAIGVSPSTVADVERGRPGYTVAEETVARWRKACAEKTGTKA